MKKQKIRNLIAISLLLFYVFYLILQFTSYQTPKRNYDIDEVNIINRNSREQIQTSHNKPIQKSENELLHKNNNYGHSNLDKMCKSEKKNWHNYQILNNYMSCFNSNSFLSQKMTLRLQYFTNLFYDDFQILSELYDLKPFSQPYYTNEVILKSKSIQEITPPVNIELNDHSEEKMSHQENTTILNITQNNQSEEEIIYQNETSSVNSEEEEKIEQTSSQSSQSNNTSNFYIEQELLNSSDDHSDIKINETDIAHVDEETLSNFDDSGNDQKEEQKEIQLKNSQISDHKNIDSIKDEKLIVKGHICLLKQQIIKFLEQMDTYRKMIDNNQQITNNQTQNISHDSLEYIDNSGSLSLEEKENFSSIQVKISHSSSKESFQESLVQLKSYIDFGNSQILAMRQKIYSLLTITITNQQNLKHQNGSINSQFNQSQTALKNLTAYNSQIEEFIDQIKILEQDDVQNQFLRIKLKEETIKQGYQIKWDNTINKTLYKTEDEEIIKMGNELASRNAANVIIKSDKQKIFVQLEQRPWNKNDSYTEVSQEEEEMEDIETMINMRGSNKNFIIEENTVKTTSQDNYISEYEHILTIQTRQITTHEIISPEYPQVFVFVIAILILHFTLLYLIENIKSLIGLIKIKRNIRPRQIEPQLVEMESDIRLQDYDQPSRKTQQFQVQFFNQLNNSIVSLNNSLVDLIDQQRIFISCVVDSQNQLNQTLNIFYQKLEYFDDISLNSSKSAKNNILCRQIMK